jgi:hypothetical protein
MYPYCYTFYCVSRIPRYELLLKDLLRHTESTDSEYEALQEALAEIRKAAKRINRAKMFNDSKAVIQELSKKVDKNGTELLLHDYIGEGPGWYSSSKSSKLQTVYIFLFSQQLLVTTTKSSQSKVQRNSSLHTTSSPLASGALKGARFELLANVSTMRSQMLDLEATQNNLSLQEEIRAHSKENTSPVRISSAGMWKSSKDRDSPTSSPIKKDHAFVLLEKKIQQGSEASESSSTLDQRLNETSICHRFIFDAKDTKVKWMENLLECLDPQLQVKVIHPSKLKEQFNFKEDSSTLSNLGGGSSRGSRRSSLEKSLNEATDLGSTSNMSIDSLAQQKNRSGSATVRGIAGSAGNLSDDKTRPSTSKDRLVPSGHLERDQRKVSSSLGNVLGAESHSDQSNQQSSRANETASDVPSEPSEGEGEQKQSAKPTRAKSLHVSRKVAGTPEPEEGKEAMVSLPGSISELGGTIVEHAGKVKRKKTFKQRSLGSLMSLFSSSEKDTSP